MGKKLILAQQFAVENYKQVSAYTLLFEMTINSIGKDFVTFFYWQPLQNLKLDTLSKQML
jgi:hypothetical protein